MFFCYFLIITYIFLTSIINFKYVIRYLEGNEVITSTRLYHKSTWQWLIMYNNANPKHEKVGWIEQLLEKDWKHWYNDARPQKVQHDSLKSRKYISNLFRSIRKAYDNCGILA